MAVPFIARSSGGVRARLELTCKATQLPKQQPEGTGMLAVFILLSIVGTIWSRENCCPNAEHPPIAEPYNSRRGLGSLRFTISEPSQGIQSEPMPVLGWLCANHREQRRKYGRRTIATTPAELSIGLKY